jgi:flagellar motor switch protein FliG
MSKVRVDGLRAAVESLQGLDQASQERILKDMAIKDPQTAELIRQSLVSFEDLRHLTPDMLRLLLGMATLEKFALALRAGSEELREFVKNNVSKNMKKDLEDSLFGPPQKLSEVRQAQTEILTIVRALIKEGKIVINPGGNEEYV